MRTGIGNIIALEESAYNPSTGELTITVIQPGFNKSKGRYYPAAMLKKHAGMFEGAKMFVNHATPAEEAQRSEGNLNDFAAVVGKPWAESDGRIRAKATVIDGPFKNKLENMAAAKLLPHMGVSIRAIGEANDQEIEGTKTKVIESFVKVRSVDFVTYAGAGGQVEAIEADVDQIDVDLIDEAQLRQRRPDLVSLIESSARKENNMTEAEITQKVAAAVEAAVAPLKTQVATLTTERDSAVSKVAEAEKVTNRAKVKTFLESELKEKGKTLPQVAKDRLVKQFAEAEKNDGISEAIVNEVAYLKTLGATAKVEGNGADDNQDKDESKVTEADIIKGYQGMGMSEAEAKIAAKGR